MMNSLFMQAISKFLIGLIVVGLLVFVPAGSLSFCNGWIFMGVLFIPMLVFGIVLYIKNPYLLKSRLNSKEEQKEQGNIVKLSGLMFILGFVAAGLNYRFKWFVMPKAVVYIAAFIFLLGYFMYAEVLRENTYLSRTIEVQDNQKVIDTGLYGIIRHPMYSATLIMFLSLPIMLGSISSFVIFLMYPYIVVKRIMNEEAYLEKELNGYTKYKSKVKYRLIPKVW